MSMTDSAPVETEKTDRAAEISREQYDRYITTFRPIENKLINSVNNETLMNEGLDRVDKNASTAGRVMTENAQMRAGRTGGMSAEQRKALDDKMELGMATANVGGRNAVRDHINERDNANLSSVVDNGMGVRSLANSSFATAAQMEASRNNTNAGIAASNTAGRWGMAGTAVGLAILA